MKDTTPGPSTPLSGICGIEKSPQRGCSESSSLIDMNVIDGTEAPTGILDPAVPIFRFNNVPTVSTARVRKIVEARQRPNFRMTNELPQASLTIQSIKPRRPQDRALVTREGLCENIARLGEVIAPSDGWRPLEEVTAAHKRMRQHSPKAVYKKRRMHPASFSAHLNNNLAPSTEF